MSAGDPQRTIGYVLVDPNTHAMDWDGEIHGTVLSAIRELETIQCNNDECQRPIDGSDVPYLVATVTVDHAIQERVLARVQEAWDVDRG